jgi:hypothetical protein
MRRLRWLFPIAILLPCRLNASDDPVRARVAAVTINPVEVTVLHLRPEFESVIRMPEEITSVILGSPGMAIPLHHYEPGNFAACSEAQKWPVEALPNHVPNRAMLEACFYHASRWAVDGIGPPHAPLIDVDANGVTEKDENGNVKGGLRFPDIAVPVETFISAARGGTRSCASTGYSIAFSREKLVSLYGSREQYLARYDAAADKLVKDGYILPEGAAQLKSDRRWLAPVF